MNAMPFKSLAGALLLSIFFGPVGLLYASTLGGIVMIILGCITVSSLLPVPMMIVWLGSCVWSVVATNQYNKKMLDKPA